MMSVPPAVTLGTFNNAWTARELSANGIAVCAILNRGSQQWRKQDADRFVPARKAAVR